MPPSAWYCQAVTEPVKQYITERVDNEAPKKPKLQTPKLLEATNLCVDRYVHIDPETGFATYKEDKPMTIQKLLEMLSYVPRQLRVCLQGLTGSIFMVSLLLFFTETEAYRQFITMVLGNWTASFALLSNALISLDT